MGAAADIIDIASARIGDNSEAALREYIQLRRQVWAKDLKPQVKLIALAIIEHMSAGRLSCFPSKARLVQMVNMADRAFDAHYADVKKLFVIEGRPGKASVFHARVEAVSAELLVMWPRSEFQPEPPADFAGGASEPPADSAPAPPADLAPPQNGTPRNFGGEPPAESAGRRDLREITTLRGRERAREEGKRPDLDDLQSKLLAAANGALANPSACPGLLLLSEPMRWIDQGCDLDQDILPALRARAHAARPNSIRSWSYFTQAVVDAKAARERPLPAAASPGNAHHPPQRSYAQQRADAEREALARDVERIRQRGPARPLYEQIEELGDLP